MMMTIVMMMMVMMIIGMVLIKMAKWLANNPFASKKNNLDNKGVINLPPTLLWQCPFQNKFFSPKEQNWRSDRAWAGIFKFCSWNTGDSGTPGNDDAEWEDNGEEESRKQSSNSFASPWHNKQVCKLPSLESLAIFGGYFNKSRGRGDWCSEEYKAVNISNERVSMCWRGGLKGVCSWTFSFFQAEVLKISFVFVTPLYDWSLILFQRWTTNFAFMFFYVADNELNWSDNVVRGSLVSITVSDNR